jgi:hypothetical protein
MSRAQKSGISLTAKDAALVKGMILRGDRQHDIAAYFGVNGGRIGEISSKRRFASVQPAPAEVLPPPGPYLSGRDAAVLIQAIYTARSALNQAEEIIRSHN